MKNPEKIIIKGVIFSLVFCFQTQQASYGKTIANFRRDFAPCSNSRTKPMRKKGNGQLPSSLNTVSTFVWKDFPTIFFQKCVSHSGPGEGGKMWQLVSL